MSSNFFLRVPVSDSTQFESYIRNISNIRQTTCLVHTSWWQKITFSRIAFLIPINSGMSLSISAQRLLVVRGSPVLSSLTWRAHSRVLQRCDAASWVNCSERVQTMGLPLGSRKRSFICAFTSRSPATYSCLMQQKPECELLLWYRE